MCVQEAVQKIREHGIGNTRITPISGSDKVKIEVKSNSHWVTVLKDITQPMAEDVMRQASSRVILG